MTYDHNADRTYWRSTETRRLIEVARDSGHELAIALGERLQDLEDADDERAELTMQLRDARSTIARLQAEVAAYETSPDTYGVGD